MRFLSTSLLAIAFTSFVAASETSPDTNSDVVVLTTESFPAFIAKENLSLIEFYAPWCGHCKALAPEYEIAATTLKESKIPIAKVDCTVENALCEEQGVKGFPTLKIFRDGVSSEFKGQRKADDIIEIMKKQALPSVSIVAADKIDDFISSENVVVVGFFDSEESKEYKEFFAFGNSLRENVVSVASFDKEALQKFETTSPSVILYKKFDERKNVYSGDFNSADLIAFVKVHSVPLMGEIGPDNYNDFVESGLPLAYFFYSSPEERLELGAQLEKVASKFKGDINFVYIDALKYGAHVQILNLPKDTWPAFAIQEPAKELKFPYSGKITEESIFAFTESYLKGEIKPSLKSQPIPEVNDEPVLVIVGENYNEIVNDKTKDVFVEFYAPWCGHCKKLAPIWDALGKKVKSVNGIVIAKIDATENDLPTDSPFRIQGFPTLKLFKAETNEIVDYSGDRSEEDLLKFIKENAV
ncbi:protein disulfide-isomerase precursor, partial [Nowakowskiella sp. JEL0078]